MSLVKFFKGLSDNLNTSFDKTKDGQIYFCTDDGKLYIDVDSNATPVIGNNTGENVGGAAVNRICINQRIFSYNDYDILDCGNAATVFTDDDIIFDCN